MPATAPGGVDGSVDPAALARQLIRCRSITPADDGALGVLERALTGIGFACRRLRFEAPGTVAVDNLYAKLGSGRMLGFAGHTDVVPPGREADWRYPPFEGRLGDEVLHGRGAVDMKGGIAAFVAAAAAFVTARGMGGFDGGIALLITGDEEGPAVNGTARLVDWMAETGERLDACLVGEPTAVDRLGDTIKVGRRGSLTGALTVHGRQGHVAYPERADNPIPALLRVLAPIDALTLDTGSDWFPASNLEIVSIETGNPTSNVIPASVSARFNIRFNDLQTTRGLIERIGAIAEASGESCEIAWTVSADSFLTPPDGFPTLVADAVEESLGIRPIFSTGGGTSDARFLAPLCPVAELGLVGDTMHQVDERVPVADLYRLADAYAAVLGRFFGS